MNIKYGVKHVIKICEFYTEIFFELNPKHEFLNCVSGFYPGTLLFLNDHTSKKSYYLCSFCTFIAKKGIIFRELEEVSFFN